jgi:hypothetical protein
MRLCRRHTLLVLSAPAALAAQTGTLTGRVVRDSTSNGVPGVEVRLPTLGLAAVASASGEFHFDRVPVGTVVLAIRHPGFRPGEDTVVIRDGKVTDHQFRLMSLPLQLDSVRVVAKPVEYISANLRAFRERQRSGSGGYFVDDSILRRNENQRLTDILASRIPALTTVRDRSAVYFASGRAASSSAGPIFSKRAASKDPRDIQVNGCWVSVYIDGVVIYNGANSPNPPPDANALETVNYAAVEYYAGGASVPAEYNRTGNGCGVLLLWTRER